MTDIAWYEFSICHPGSHKPSSRTPLRESNRRIRHHWTGPCAPCAPKHEAGQRRKDCRECEKPLVFLLVMHIFEPSAVCDYTIFADKAQAWGLWYNRNMKRTVAIVLSGVMAIFAGSVRAGETHADGIVREILAVVAKVKAADPSAVPMAFWDFDGTIIKGDIAVGLNEGGNEVYKGLFVQAADAGFSSRFRDGAHAAEYMYGDYRKVGKTVGRWMAWPSLGQSFHGTDADQLESFCRKYAETTLKAWYFASSLRILRALDEAGVENHIVSGSPDVFVKAAAVYAGVPRQRALGIRQRVAGGRLTTQLEYPLSMNEGKVECIRETLNACPGAVAVAAFGNSYWTDGPFMRYVVTNPLPGGAKGVAMMINGGPVPKGYEGLFRCVEQNLTAAEASK